MEKNQGNKGGHTLSRIGTKTQNMILLHHSEVKKHLHQSAHTKLIPS